MDKTRAVHAMKSGITTSLGLLAVLAAGAAHADSAGAGFTNGYKFAWKDGQAMYEHVCQECHMPDAQGATGAGTYPALAADPRLAAKTYPVYMVVNGKGAMPRLGEYMDDEQVAAVVNYVRTHFGNQYTDAVTAADAKAVRPKVMSTTKAK